MPWMLWRAVPKAANDRLQLSLLLLLPFQKVTMLRTCDTYIAETAELNRRQNAAEGGHHAADKVGLSVRTR